MKKTWLWAGLAFLVLMSFILSDSLWTTLSRKSSLRRMEKEMGLLSGDLQAAHQKISSLEKDPKNYEQLVRQELNYLRPNEKEVRFVEKKGK